MVPQFGKETVVTSVVDFHCLVKFRPFQKFESTGPQCHCRKPPVDLQVTPLARSPVFPDHSCPGSTPPTGEEPRGDVVRRCVRV